MLPEALESVLAQETGGVGYEFIVVDNNSQDGTRQVVESFINRGHAQMRYIFEGKQGLSHARNAAIMSARAPIIAFTDDDVRVAGDWVKLIKQAFDEHPEVDFVGGKVLPRWESKPPAWLTPEHWSPLALVDHGEKPFYVNQEKPICLVGANLSFRREVFEQVGLFAADLQRVKDSVGSIEDHELEARLWRSGRQGIYVPNIIVTAEVQTDRTEKEYHRRWHTGHGRFYAIMREEKFEQSSERLFDVPVHLYRAMATDAAQWLKDALRGKHEAAFLHELRLRFSSSFIKQRRRDFVAAGGHRTAHEIATFAHRLVMRKKPADFFERRG